MSDTTTSQVDLDMLARLAGFESSPSSNETQTIELPNENPTPLQSTETNEEINLQISIEENAEDDSSPLIPPEELEEEVTIDQWSFTPNRINKVALFVGAGVISLLIGFFTTFNQQATTEPDEQIASEVTPLTDDLDSDPTAERLGEAQTDLALGEQERQLQQLNESQVKPPRPKKTTSPPSPKPVQPQPVKVATPPPPRTPRRLQQPVAVRPISRPLPPPAPRQIPTPITPPVAVQEEPDVDPQTAWLEAATAGMMGGSSHQTASQSAPTQAIYTGTDDPIALASLETNNLVAAPDPNLEAPILEGRPREVEVIPANTRIRGVLSDALAWDDPRLVVEAPVRIALTESIVHEGEELLPPGTEIMAMVQQARPSGLVMLTATGIEYPTETEYRSVRVDPGTISIKLTDGMPLMAQRMQQGGQQPGVDAGGLMLDVLGTVAPIITGGSGNPYRDMYQINQVQQVYSRHFSQRSQPNNYYTPQTPNFWLLPRDLEVELIIRKPIRILSDNYDD
ncbi:MAG: hypothetical protein QNJ37_08730 [Crocosphaera sp.]|nr:hypothetical protein [Crocosphaera sp.]